MTSLKTAHSIHRTLTAAKIQLEYHLSGPLQEYIDFLPERGSSWVPEKFFKAVDYSFREIDGTAFVFESEEYYAYGEHEQDIIELPFAFVEDPKGFKENLLASMRAEAAKRAERNREAAQIRVTNLRRQLEVAERSLTDAEQQGDTIKATATRNEIDTLKAETAK